MSDYERKIWTLQTTIIRDKVENRYVFNGVIVAIYLRETRFEMQEDTQSKESSIVRYVWWIDASSKWHTPKTSIMFPCQRR